MIEQMNDVSSLILSVSPIGSSPLQLVGCALTSAAWLVFQYPQSDRALCNNFRAYRDDFDYRDFQYPQSDRALCNWRRRRAVTDFADLSVSPIGSSPLQLTVAALALGLALCLSVSPIGSSPLQLGLYWLCPGVARFQYPQSDRALCNLAPHPQNWRRHPTFSIPNRIEPSATC